MSYSPEALAALVDAAQRHFAEAGRNRKTRSCSTASRGRSAGHGPQNTQERQRHRREREHSESAPALNGVVASGQSVMLRERQKAWTRNRQETQKAHREASSRLRRNLPFRWFESASDPVDRDGSRVGQTTSVMAGRRFAGYALHRPLRAHSADPVLRSDTEYSSSFVDESHMRDVIQAPETVYTREKRRDALVALIGGDPRRTATAAALRDKYGATDYQNGVGKTRSSEDHLIALGISPDIEATRKDVEQAYRGVAERRLRELSLMESARASALSERRSQSARAPVRDMVQLSSRSDSDATQILRAELQRSSEERLEQDVKNAKLKMSLRRQSSLPISPERSSNSGSFIDHAAGARQNSISLTDHYRVSAEVDARLIETLEKSDEAEIDDDELMEATRLPEELLSPQRMGESFSTTEWANLTRSKPPAYERSLSGCSTTASSYCSSATGSSRRSTRAGLRQSVPARPKSAKVLPSMPNQYSIATGTAADVMSAVTSEDRRTISEVTEELPILHTIAEVCTRAKHRRIHQSGSSAHGKSDAQTRRRPSSAVARLQSSQRDDRASSQSLEDTILHVIDELRSRQHVHNARPHGVLSESGTRGAISTTSSRRRPSSAVARLQTSSSDKTISAKTKASCGSAHQAVRAARQRPSSASSHRLRDATF